MTSAERTHCRCDPVHSWRSAKRFRVTWRIVSRGNEGGFQLLLYGRWRSSRGALLRMKTTLSYTWRSKKRSALLSYFFSRACHFFHSSISLLILRSQNPFYVARTIYLVTKKITKNYRHMKYPSVDNVLTLVLILKANSLPSFLSLLMNRKMLL